MDAPLEAPLPSTPSARFVTGSTFRHVVVMTGTASVGLMAIFVVDLLSLLYISWLGDPKLTAAVGFATIILFVATSINIGLMIAVTALVARALGAENRAQARRLAASSLTLTVLSAGLISLIMLPLLSTLLSVMGAQGETLDLAVHFLKITLPANILMALGMAFSGLLRAVGDAKRAMYVTLSGGLLVAMLDPLLIFVFKLGIDGAAIAIVGARIVFALVGYYGAVRVHDLVAPPHVEQVRQDARATFAIAAPAILTNVATPLAGVFFTGVLSQFGDKAIAGNAIIDRVIPVAFGGLFALSGAVGPILGQNWGALRFDRMRGTLRDSVVFTAAYVGLVWLLLVLLRGPLVNLFSATDIAAEMVLFFCLISGPLWFFNGLLFVANASFNNLGFPLLSTAFNWGRATIGTMPFAAYGAHFYGPKGAFIGIALGSVLFGVGAIWMAFRTINRLEKRVQQRGN
jgi:putative MATE family efflux protein